MIAKDLVDRVDWGLFRAANGVGDSVGVTLVDLLTADSAADAERAFQGLENVVFAQDDVFQVAEPAVDILFAGLSSDLPAHVQIAALDVLFHVLQGGSSDDPELAMRIRARAHRGVWLLVRLATTSSVAASAAVEILQLIDESAAELCKGS